MGGGQVRNLEKKQREAKSALDQELRLQQQAADGVRMPSLP